MRIEDTDRTRFVEGAQEDLIKTLAEVGIDWDEGPYEDKGVLKQKGKFGPYIQSQRIETYRNLAQKLVESGHAYYCFCRPEELEKMRKMQAEAKIAPKYDGRCRNLTEEERDAKIRQNLPYVIRLKVSSGQGSVKFKDLIRGEVEFKLENIDDQILLKSDGWPTYHLANVIDDHLMGITHVVRGEEWLPSTPKHILIYQALGWEVPQFGHLPLLLNPDRTKLSKRQGDVAVEDYLARGYLPQSLLNFLALLGWNPGTEDEIFSVKELIKKFSLERIQKAGAIFNREKLDWINGYYIRKMELNELARKCLPYLIQDGLIESLTPGSKFQIPKTKEIVNFNWLKKIVALEQERLKRLGEIGELTKFFFIEELEYDSELLRWKKMNNRQIEDNLGLGRDALIGIPPLEFKAQKITDSLMKIAALTGTGELFWPLRVALTGRKASPPPSDVAGILGKEKTLSRIEKAIAKIK